MISNDDKWRNYLTPSILRTNLISCSVFIISYELLADAITNRVKEAYSQFFEYNNKSKNRYATEVLSRNKSPLYATLYWLLEENVLSTNDLSRFELVKKTRNQIAHEIVNLIQEGLPSELQQRFEDILYLISKVEKWWFISFEVPVDEEFDGKDINEDQIIPGIIASLRVLVDVALGNDEDSTRYLKGLDANSE